MASSADPTSSFLSAPEAAELLGIKLPTLYAYVSRGLLQSVPGPGRAKRYRREEVERLRARGRGAAEAGEADAMGALRWGAPVLESTITRVTPEGPRYREHAARELVERGVGFERVAELLWTGALPDDARWELPGERHPLGLSASRLARLLPAVPLPQPLLALLVPALAAQDPGRYDRRPEGVLPRARLLIRRMSAGLALVGPEEGRRERLDAALAAPTVAESAAIALRARGAAAGVAAIDRALVLWADHELNVSSFAARVVASTDADPYACVSAGLAAMGGPRHGAACEQIEALVEEAGRPERAAAVIHERARRGEAVPGFGHPLYPAGDPRALPMLEDARTLGARSRRVATVLALIDAVAAENGLSPTIDVGMVALAAALRLHRGVAPGLIAVGRCAGWIAHTLEQYQAGFLIRPRARYRGVVVP